MRATYSIEDDKLRLYLEGEWLDRPVYDRLCGSAQDNGHGFSRPGKYGVALAVWTPSREDLMLEFVGNIEKDVVAVAVEFVRWGHDSGVVCGRIEKFEADIRRWERECQPDSAMMEWLRHDNLDDEIFAEKRAEAVEYRRRWIEHRQLQLVYWRRIYDEREM